MSAPQNAAAADPAGHDVSHAEHGPSPALLAGILFALLVLTGITVAASNMEFGALALWVALAIATIKATLVALYFMHLRYERPFNAVILVAALAFVALFVAASLTDTEQYQANIASYRQEDPTRYAPALYNQPPAAQTGGAKQP